MRDATADPGGRDAVVAGFGAVAFERPSEVGDAIAEHLYVVNVLASAACSRAALTVVGPGPVSAVSTGVVAEYPRAGTAGHGASRSAPSAWLGAVRREVRASGIPVPEAGPGHHPDTGVADRPVVGTAPPMPAGGGPHRVVAVRADATETDAELPLSALDGAPVVERRAR